MNAGRWITHGLAVCCGFAGAFALSGKGTPKVEVAPEVARPRSYATRASARPNKIRSRELLRSLSSVPMESQERENLKSEIYSEWAEQNPLGFLAHFEHRPWFGYMHAANPFRILAKTQPEELLAYARRTGCQEAAHELINCADPAQVLALLKQEGGGRFHKDLLERLVEKGQDLDPHFHEKLAEISDVEARKTALAEAASRMEMAGRAEDFFSFIRQYPDVLEPEDAGRSVGKLMLMDPRELGRLDSLEVEIQEAAAEEIIDSIHDDNVSEHGQREILAALATRGLLDARQKEVFESVVEVIDTDDISSEAAVAWKDWGLSLPGSPETRPLRLASMVLWSISTKAEADDFTSVPEGELRDGAVVGGVGRYLQDEKFPEARKMIGLIADSALREKIEGYLTLMEKGEEPEDFNPFGFEE